MKHSDLLPGDVVFPSYSRSLPWVVISSSTEGMLCFNVSDGTFFFYQREVADHAFSDRVLIVRGSQAVNGAFP